MRRLLSALLLLIPVGALAAAPDTGWGALLVGSSVVVLAILTIIATAIGFKVSSGWKAISIASLPTIVLLGLPAFHGQAIHLAHQALEANWERASSDYIANSCASTVTRPLSVSRAQAFGVLIPTFSLVDLQNTTESSDGFVTQSLLRFAYGSEADRLNRDRFQTPVTRLPFYTSRTWLSPGVTDYVESVESDSVVRTASRSYWLKHEAAIPAGKILPGQLLGSSTSTMTIPVAAVASTHALLLTDTSTASDRQNWTVRLHAKLVNRTTGGEDAEFVGLIPLLPSFPSTREGYKTCGEHPVRAWHGAGLDWPSYVLSELVTRR